MSYANKKLTIALQRIVEIEKTPGEQRENFTAHRQNDNLSLRAQSGISDFLRKRISFRECTQHTNVGSY